MEPTTDNSGTIRRPSKDRPDRPEVDLCHSGDGWLDALVADPRYRTQAGMGRERRVARTLLLLLATAANLFLMSQIRLSAQDRSPEGSVISAAASRPTPVAERGSFFDTCSDVPLEVLQPGGSLMFTGDNTGATVTETWSAEANAWIGFIVEECMHVSWEVCGSQAAQFIAFSLYTGCPDIMRSVTTCGYGTYTCPAGDENFFVDVARLEPGTYYIRIPYNPPQYGGAYVFNIRGEACAPVIAPANDECSGAIVLEHATSCAPQNGTLINASRSLPDATSCLSDLPPVADDDVWYRFVAATEQATITIQPAAQVDIVFQVYDGACSPEAVIACGDTGGDGEEDELSLDGLTIGNEYLIRVHSWLGGGACGTGGFTICVVQDTDASIGSITSVGSLHMTYDPGTETHFVTSDAMRDEPYRLIDALGRTVAQGTLHPGVNAITHVRGAIVLETTIGTLRLTAMSH